MRRWDKGYHDGEAIVAACMCMAVVVFFVWLIVMIAGAPTKKPISYAMKNTPTYIVKAECSNCKQFHRIETSIGVEVKTDHVCPWCGVKKLYTVHKK